MPATNTIEIILKATDNATSTIGGVSKTLDNWGGGLTKLGGAITTLAAPAAAVIGVSVKQAVDFDEAMTNIQAVTGKSTAEMAILRQQIISTGAASRFGPQAAADAFYDIVGGVADASTHMAIFQQAISAAQAGNADLGSTTKALISVMNSYKFGADKAGFSSDVLTQTVSKGVGTMNDFATALPQVTGLANSLNIGFDDLGGMAAYLTTQGNSASGSVTQLGAMMTAVLKPNEVMAAGLKEMGYSSGEAAIQALGLTGTMQGLAGTHAANTKGMAALLGTTEALRGATALAGPDVAAFMTTFKDGLNGATEAAENVQMTSAAAQVDLLKSSVSELGIEVGTTLLPVLKDLVQQMLPVITQVVTWVKQNPELVKQVGTIAVVALGAGVAIMGAGTAISAVSTIVAAAATPWGALLLAITAVIAAYKQWQTFQGQVQGGQQSVVTAHGAAIASGQITEKQYEDQAFKSAVSQLGDAGARAYWAAGGRAVLMKPYYDSLKGNAASKDFGGSGQAGTPYMIGRGAQPELFIPRTNGTFVPNADQMGGGGGANFSPGSIVIYANSEAEGAAAGRGLRSELKDLIRMSG